LYIAKNRGQVVRPERPNHSIEGETTSSRSKGKILRVGQERTFISSRELGIEQSCKGETDKQPIKKKNSVIFKASGDGWVEGGARYRGRKDWGLSIVGVFGGSLHLRYSKRGTGGKIRL